MSGDVRAFPYGDVEMDYLRSADARLGEVIDALGHITREMDGDLFSSICHHIVAQQISNAALATVWGRLLDLLGGEASAKAVLSAGPEALQACGMSHRKAGYLTELARRVEAGELDLEALPLMDDETAIRELTVLPGVGRWTAEMTLIFSLARPDVLSFDDLAIQRGMRMVFHHRKVTREVFERHRRRLSPYCTTASIYLWAVAAGAIPGMRDWAPRTRKR